MPDQPLPQPVPETPTVEDMAKREGKRRPGKRRPGFDRAMDTQDRPTEPTVRRPGTYETK